MLTFEEDNSSCRLGLVCVFTFGEVKAIGISGLVAVVLV